MIDIEKNGLLSKDTKELLLTGVSFVFGTFCLALCYNLFFGNIVKLSYRWKK